MVTEPAAPAAWPTIKQQAGDAVLQGFALRDGLKPATVPTPTLKTSPDASTDKPVLFMRDEQAWCPFCERVWLALEEKRVPYDCMLINLRDKPAWYQDLVPTKLVPAVKLHGDKVVYESKDILLALEEQFPEHPLLPVEEAARAEALQLMDGADAFGKVGYTFMAGRSFGDSASNGAGAAGGEEDVAAAEAARRDAFTQAAAALDAQLAERGGPFFLGRELSLVDVMYMPQLERFAANMPAIRGFALRGNPSLPHLDAWYAAMDARPTYQKVKSDDGTLNLVMRRLFDMAAPPPSPLAEGPDTDARREVAAKIAANNAVIIADIVKNSGIVHSGPSCHYGVTSLSINGRAPEPMPATINAIDYSLRQLCSYLLTGDAGPRHADAEGRAIGAATLAFFMNRASAPRDMSAAAATQLRAACLEVIKMTY